jgi:hypothetical protein
VEELLADDVVGGYGPANTGLEELAAAKRRAEGPSVVVDVALLTDEDDIVFYKTGNGEDDVSGRLKSMRLALARREGVL